MTRGTKPPSGSQAEELGVSMVDRDRFSLPLLVGIPKQKAQSYVLKQCRRSSRDDSGNKTSTGKQEDLSSDPQKPSKCQVGIAIIPAHRN